MENKTDKIIVTRNLIETFNYEKQRKPTLPQRHGGRKKNGEMSGKSMEYKKLTVIKQKIAVKRYVLGHFGIGASVWTLTFAEHNYDSEKETVSQDIDDSRKVFKNFINRLRTNSKEEQYYLAVWEFNKAGIIHFHMITNLNLSEESLTKLWAHANETHIGKIKSQDDLYKVFQYFVKNFHDPRIGSRTPYITSKNLSKPQTFTSEESIKTLSDYYKLSDRKPESINTYDTMYQGKAEVKSFILE